MGNGRILIVDDDLDLVAVMEYEDIPVLMPTGVEGKTGAGFRSTAGDPQWLPANGFPDKPVEPQVLPDEVNRLPSRKV
jgi:hypothetical protein